MRPLSPTPTAITLALIALASTPLAAQTAADAPRTTRTITVTGSTIDDRFGELANEPTSTTVLAGRKIEAQHAENLVQVLKAVPGITVDYVGGDELKIKFRGIENQRYMGEKPGVAIVIDGVPVFERTGKVNVDLDNIESIKIIKGGASYLYGEDALAGAVVITTKRGATNRGVSVEYDLGEDGYERKLARAGFATDRWSGHLQASQRSADGYHYQSNYDAKGLTANLRFAPNNHSDLTLGIEKEERFRDKHGTVTGITQAANDPRGFVGRDFARHFDVDLERINLTYSNDLNERTNLLALVYQYRDHTLFWSSPQRFSATGAAVTASDAYTTLNDYRQSQRGFKTELRSSSGDWAWMGGLELKRNSYANLTSAKVSYRNSPVGATTAEGTVFGDDDTAERGRALYGEVKWSPVEAWTFTANGRFDRIELDYIAAPVSGNGNTALNLGRSFNAPSWRLGAAFAASKQTTWFGNVSTGFRTPTADQLYRGSQSPTSAVANNPDLKPEHAVNVEAGVRHLAQWLGREASIEATVFQIRRDDFILDSNGQYAGSNAANISRYENVGGVRSRGLELAVKSSFTNAWTWDTAYTYLQSKFTRYDNFLLSLGNNRGTLVGATPACTPGNVAFSWNNCYTFQAYNNTGKSVPRVPPHALNLRTAWQPNDTWKFTGEADYRAAAWADEINQERWPGRTVFNLSIDYSRKIAGPLPGKFSAFVRVDNVLDRRYYLIARGTNDSQSPTTASRYDGVYNAEDLSITVDPGRVWRAGIAYRF